MQPVQVTLTGNGISTPIIPDTKQNPFNIGLGLSVNTAGTVTTWAVEHCFDFSTVMSPTWNGSTGVTWFQNSGMNNVLPSAATPVLSGASPVNGNYAFAVAAIRLNISNAGISTAVFTLNIIQSVNSP